MSAESRALETLNAAAGALWSTAVALGKLTGRGFAPIAVRSGLLATALQTLAAAERNDRERAGIVGDDHILDSAVASFLGALVAHLPDDDSRAMALSAVLARAVIAARTHSGQGHALGAAHTVRKAVH